MTNVTNDKVLPGRDKLFIVDDDTKLTRAVFLALVLVLFRRGSGRGRKVEKLYFVSLCIFDNRL